MTRTWKPTEDDLVADDWNLYVGTKKAEQDKKSIIDRGVNKPGTEHEDFFMKVKLEKEGKIYSIYLNGEKLRGVKKYKIWDRNEKIGIAELELHMDVQLEAKIENHIAL